MTSREFANQFEQFLAEELADDEVRAAFEDAQSRNRIVDALVRMRHRLGLTQKDVANSMGVKQPTISGFETEASDPRISTIFRYARAVDSVVAWDVRPQLDQVRIDSYRPEAVTVLSSVNRDAPSRRAVGWQDQMTHRERWLRAAS